MVYKHIHSPYLIDKAVTAGPRDSTQRTIFCFGVSVGPHLSEILWPWERRWYEDTLLSLNVP